jgi:hypothetical protein
VADASPGQGVVPEGGAGALTGGSGADSGRAAVSEAAARSGADCGTAGGSGDHSASVLEAASAAWA